MFIYNSQQNHRLKVANLQLEERKGISGSISGQEPALQVFININHKQSEYISTTSTNFISG